MVGRHLTRNSPYGVDWRPFTASLCAHFLLALAIALLLAPPPDRASPAAISVARVTLKSAPAAPRFVEQEENALDEALLSPVDTTAESPGNDAPPLSVKFGDGEIAAPLISVAAGATPSVSTPRGGEILGGARGNTEADERLMQKDIERYLANQPPSGPSTEIKLFGGEIAGHSFVFVIDRSASTASKHATACAEIEKECAAAIDALPSENRFQVILYNDRISPAKGLLLATDKEKDAAKERMIRFVPSGGTMHADGLRAALLLRSNVVCWFSDGGDPYLSAREIEELALLAARSKTAIHAWRLGKAPADSANDFMRTLAERTGGQFHEGLR